MNDAQLLRYSRHIFLPEIDIAGQEKLLASTVLVVGLGGLGSPLALYLAASGVGHLMLADKETVDISNLQRQILYTHDDVETLKTTAAKKRIHALNPETKITLIDDLNEKNLADYVMAADCVVDCSDNFTTRFAINEACVKNKTPLVSGAAIKFTGQLCVFDFKHHVSPCYQCLYPDGLNDDLSCQDQGVLAPLVGVIGSLQAIEVIKLLLGLSPKSHLVQVDALHMNFRSSPIMSDPNCVVCEADTSNT